MKFDLTVTISAILAICAIISPLLTAIISNRYKLSKKRMEIRYKHYSEINMKIIQYLEDFSQALTNVYNAPKNIKFESLITTYQNTLGKAAPYMSQELFDKIGTLNFDHLWEPDLYVVLALIRADIERYQKLPELK